MRIALVVERFVPAGGIEGVVWRIAPALAAAGDEVHVLAREAEPQAGLTIHQLSAPSFWQPLRVRLFDRAATAIVERERFDIVHAFCRTSTLDIFHAGGGSHAAYIEETYGRWGGRWRRLSPRHRLQLRLENRIFARPSIRVHCVSQMVADDLRAQHGVPRERLDLLHYGVDPERFAPECWRAAGLTLRRAEEAGDRLVWLFAGSGFRRKGLDTALRALAGAADRSAVLWVAGGDDPAPWRRRARRLGLADRVRFLGLRTDMEALYAAADGLLFPTRYDAFGLVCLEAAAAALPVVTSARAGASELVRSAGRVVEDAGDARAFARAMDELADPELRRSLGREGLTVADRHTWDRHVGTLRSLYRDLRAQA